MLGHDLGDERPETADQIVRLHRHRDRHGAEGAPELIDRRRIHRVDDDQAGRHTLGGKASHGFGGLTRDGAEREHEQIVATPEGLRPVEDFEGFFWRGVVLERSA